MARPGNARPSWTYDLSPENRFRPPLSADEWNINNQFRKTNIAKISFLRSLFLRASFLTLSLSPPSLSFSLSLSSPIPSLKEVYDLLVVHAFLNVHPSSESDRESPFIVSQYPFPAIFSFFFFFLFFLTLGCRAEETIIHRLIRVTQIYPVKYLPGRTFGVCLKTFSKRFPLPLLKIGRF